MVFGPCAVMICWFIKGTVSNCEVTVVESISVVKILFKPECYGLHVVSLIKPSKC